MRSGLPALLDSEDPGLPFFDHALGPVDELANPHARREFFCCNHVFDGAGRYAKASDE